MRAVEENESEWNKMKWKFKVYDSNHLSKTSWNKTIGGFGVELGLIRLGIGLNA